MSSIRARLLVALIILVALISLLAAGVTYRRVLTETSTLFDYQLRQMALSLRSQISLAPRIEVPPDQGDSDFVVQIWDVFGARTYVSRPGLPMINQTVLGYADLNLRGQPWRAYGLQTADGVIQIAQPVQVREALARAAAERVVIPLILLLPIMIGAVAWIVRRGLTPLRFVAAEVQRRDARSLAPLGTDNLPREIEPLVGELNRLLERLQRAFAAQRAFISDAAHELRSPLTALRLQLQLLDRAPDEAGRLEAADAPRCGGRTRHPSGRAAAGAGAQRAARSRHGLRESGFGGGGGRGNQGHARLSARPEHRLGPGRGTGALHPGQSRSAANAGAQSRRQCRALHASGRNCSGALPVHGAGRGPRCQRLGPGHRGAGSRARVRPLLSTRCSTRTAARA